MFGIVLLLPVLLPQLLLLLLPLTGPSSSSSSSSAAAPACFAPSPFLQACALCVSAAASAMQALYEDQAVPLLSPFKEGPTLMGCCCSSLLLPQL
jgi:hypothetical protein